MKHLDVWVKAAAALLILLVGVGPVLAQEGDQGAAQSVLVVLVGVLSAVGAIGLSVVFSLRGVGLLAERLRQDDATITAIERLADSVPSDVAAGILTTLTRMNDTLRDLSSSVGAITRLVDEALDGVPAADKGNDAPGTVG